MAVVERLIEGLEICVSVLDERIRESPPDYATIGSAGLDLRACIDQPLVLLPGAAALLPTGLAVYIGHPGYAGMVLPRSGLGAVHGLVLGNLVGLIDPDYQGPLKLSCWNRGAESYTIRPMERVAQMIFLPFVKAKLNWVDDFSPTARGVGGFGSTGVD